MALVRWNGPLLPVSIFVALVAVTLAAQQRGTAPAAPAQGAGGNPNPNATGVVAFEPIDGMLTRRLRFEAGARTNWHTHTHRQMLWAEEGRGPVGPRLP